MNVKLRYRVTEDFRQKHLIATGEEFPSRPHINIDMRELTPEQRSVIVACEISTSDVALPPVVKGVDLQAHSGPKFVEEYDTFAFNEPPTLEGWLEKAQERLAIRARFQPLLDQAVADKRAADEAKARRISELLAEYKQLQGEWLPRICSMSEAEANQPLPSHIVDIERELEQLGQSRLWNKLSDEKHSRWENAREARIKAEAAEAKRQWIEANGSDQLRRAFARGHDCGRKYTLERAAQEAPGFVVDYENAAAWRDRSCPSAQALDAAEAAEGLGLGGAQIVWLTEEPRDSKPEDDYGYGEMFEPTEAVVLRKYLGKYDLVQIV